MADVEVPSDFFFSCVLKSCSLLAGSFSAVWLTELGPPGGVASFLRLAGIPLASQRVLIVFSGSEPRAATSAGAMKRSLSIPDSKLWREFLYCKGIQSGISTSSRACIMMRAAP